MIASKNRCQRKQDQNDHKEFVEPEIVTWARRIVEGHEKRCKCAHVIVSQRAAEPNEGPPKYEALDQNGKVGNAGPATMLKVNAKTREPPEDRSNGTEPRKDSE